MTLTADLDALDRIRTADVDALDRALDAYWRPPRRLSLSEWADRNFVLPEGDANAGRWRTLPYQRGPLDAMSDPQIERVTWMKSARVGYTKGFCAAVAYYIDHDPCPIMIVQPTTIDAKDHSKEDIAPMLAEVPALRGKVSEAKSRDSKNTILAKSYPGGTLTIVGANSPRGFRRTSRRVVLLDEVDGYPESAGSEGDPYELAVRRTEYYWNRKIVAGSTPTIGGFSKIERLFRQGDQRRYYVPCPECGEFQVLFFANLRWPDGHPELAYFVCTANGCEIVHAKKRDMIEAGAWRAEAPEHFTEQNRHASFHIWAAYSYSPNATWGQLAAEFLKANEGGTTTLKTFVNTVLGEPWQDRSETPPWEKLVERREVYEIGTIPAGGLFLTCGVDVQKDRLVYEVVAWGRGKTSWSIEYGNLPGDTAKLEGEGSPWIALDGLLNRMFPHAYGTAMPIRVLAVDSGYNTQTVYSWGRRYPMTRVIAVKGQDGGAVIIGAPSDVDVKANGKRLRRGYKVWPVSVNIVKSELYGFLRLELPPDEILPPAPGFCHFPQYDDAYFREITAEQLVPEKTKRGYVVLRWSLIPGRVNHALDARVYARAAAALAGLDRLSEAEWRILERSAGKPDDPAPVRTVLALPPAPTPEEGPEAPEAPTVFDRAEPHAPSPSPTSPSLIPRRTGWLGRRGDYWRRR